MTQRLPFGVMILAALSGVALILAIIHFLQALGIVPYFIGEVAIRTFNLWYVLLWGLMIWVWAWVFRALVALDPSAWVFLIIVSGFNLLFDFMAVAFSSTTVSDLALSFIVNLVIFGYALLPGTKRAFDVP